MPGPPKTPTALRVLRGNPGKRALPENEPRIEVAIPRAPSDLSPLAKKHFPKIAKQLADAKVMTKLDTDALSMYCEAYARWIDANKKVAGSGVIIKSPQGYPIQNPYLAVSNRAFDQMKSLLSEFGMTPAARTRVQTVPDETGGGGDPWSKV